MANLIPLEAQRGVQKEYWVRVLVVWCMLVAFGLLLITILMVPVYILIESQTSAYATLYSEATIQSDQIASLEAVINESNTVAEKLVENTDDTKVSEYITDITDRTNQGVQVTNFAYTGGATSIGIGGTAKTRANLAAFKTALEESEKFERVELPISSLASERDIDFSMELILVQPTL